MDIRSSKVLLIATVSLLFLAAATGIAYKICCLKFSLSPDKRSALWQIEARIAFNPDGGPIRVSLAAPESHPGFRVFSVEQLADDAIYHFQMTGLGSERRAEWLAEHAEGPQVLRLRLKLYDTETADAERAVGEAPQERPAAPYWTASERPVVDRLVDLACGAGEESGVIALNFLRYVFRPDESSGVTSLLPAAPTVDDRVALVIKLLAELDIPARPVYGLQLVDGRRRDTLIRSLDVYYDRAWRGFDIDSLTPGFPANFLAVRRGGKSILDVEGGVDSVVRFNVSLTSIPASVLISARVDTIGRTLGALSIYDLPLESQNIFMRIAMIPLGILIVVVVRNLIGLQTMGTFMPVLIAMAFMDTTLAPGIINFLTIVVLGLLIRFFLDRLNLLLVPRIAAVVLVVIFLMKALSVVSHEIGFSHGLSVTFFPLIIMAWTIERSSILWEEEGPRNTLKQFAASLGTGIICYFVLANRHVRHIAFTFAEVDLIILGLVLLIGSYTGYRLTELRRFKSLVKK